MEVVPFHEDQDIVLRPEEKYAGVDFFLSEDAIKLRRFDRTPSKRLKNGEVTKRFIAACQESFELVGGVPRLAVWADQNYGEFVKIMAKTIPSSLHQLNVDTGGGPVQIVTAIPPSKLDD